MLQAMKKVDKQTIELLKCHFHKIAKRERKSKLPSAKTVVGDTGTNLREASRELKIRTENLEEICNRMMLAESGGGHDGSDADLVDLSLQFFDQGIGLHLV
jgi:hypothetical protein